MSAPSRRTCSVVVIGAGCIGTSIAYALARRGVSDVMVIDREPYAGSGSTAKAAGGIRAQFSTPANVRVSMLAIEHYRRFAEEMGTTPVYFPVGYLFLLADPDRWVAFQNQADMQRNLGLDTRTLSVDEIQALVPELHVEDLVGGTFCPSDGLGLPHEVTQAYVQQGRRLGVTYEFDCPAIGLEMVGGKVAGVLTPGGTIATPLVINAAGPHAAEVARWAGFDLPVRPIRRHCFTTHPLAFARESLPMIVDMKSGVYMHRESGGVLLGLSNSDEPEGFNSSVNWDFLPRVVEPAIHRLPALASAEIANGWAGLYETTPDHNAVIGVPVTAPGLMLANGFSGHGFMHAPAVGQLVAEWIVDGAPSLDLEPFRPERFAENETVVETNVI